MDNILDENTLNRINSGNYSSYGANVYEPAISAVTGGYRNLTARGEPDSALKAGGLRRHEAVGSMGGQMPTGEAADAMNRAIGLTSRRYGATGPDPNGVEAIGSRHIERMGIMEDSAEPEPYRQPGARAGSGAGSPYTQPQSSFSTREQPLPDNRRTQPALQAAQGRAALHARKKPAAQEIGLVKQLAAELGRERFEKLVRDLSKMAAKMPAEIIGARKSADPTGYVSGVSRFRQKPRG